MKTPYAGKGRGVSYPQSQIKEGSILRAGDVFAQQGPELLTKNLVNLCMFKSQCPGDDLAAGIALALFLPDQGRLLRDLRRDLVSLLA